MVLHVPLQVTGPRESLAAQGAAMRALTGVDPSVPVQTGIMAEDLTANTADELGRCKNT